MIDLDLSNPVNQVRVIVGDIDGSLISDSNIQFVIDKNNNDLVLASEEVLNYLINVVAHYVREESGDVQVYWGENYDRLKSRLDDLVKSNLYKKVDKLFYFGGTVKADVQAIKDNDNYVGVGFTTREFEKVTEVLGISLDDPYYVR